MFADLRLFPEQASTSAEKVDNLFFFQLGVTSAVALLITVLIVYFAVRYRRRTANDRTARIHGALGLEIFWTAVPFVLFILMFVWGASVFFANARPPDDALTVYVVGKQWMWKVQHPDGQREINELHVPVGRPVKLVMTSEDVIHDFFVPAFRTKADVLPGRYTTIWFQATKADRYHLFCSQYCGTNHSGMIGWVHALEPAEYDNWLSSHAEGSLALKGRQLFPKLQCVSCHSADSHARAPVLEGLYGTWVPLRGGGRVYADDGYIRESILKPRAKVVEGWEPIMPTFDGQLADGDLTQEYALLLLIAYIKSLGRDQTPVRNEEFPPPAVNPNTPEAEKR